MFETRTKVKDATYVSSLGERRIKKSAYKRVQQTVKLMTKKVHDTASSMMP